MTQVFTMTGARRLQLRQRRRRSARLDAVLEEILRRHVRRARLGRLPEAQYPRSRLFGGRRALGQYQRQRPRSMAPASCSRSARRIGWTAPATSPSPTGQGAKGATRRPTAAPTIRAPARSTAYQTVYDLRRAGFADRPGQRRLPAAPAALREFRAGHRAHRRHADLPVEAEREHDARRSTA